MRCDMPRRQVNHGEVVLGQLIHESTADDGNCRAWLIVNGPYVEPAQGRTAWRLMNVDEEGTPTGHVAQMYPETTRLFHWPRA